MEARAAHPTPSDTAVTDVGLDDLLRRIDAGVVLHLGGADADAVRTGAVVIGDPSDRDARPGAVVLLPGVADIPAAVDALAPAALVVRAVSPPAGLAADGPALLGIDPGMPWDRAFLLLSAALDSALADAAGGPSGTARGRIGDLFALADAVAGAVAGSVLVLDAQNRVLAFSGDDQPTDEWRQGTILGRRVPEEWERRFHREGLYDRMRTPGEVVVFDLPEEPAFRQRRAVGVHAGGRVIGAIAVAQGVRPFDADTDAALREAARMASLHLLRHSSRQAVGAHRQDERIRELLAGSGDAGAAVARLGLPSGQPLLVVAVAPPGGSSETAVEGVGQLLRMRLPRGLEVVDVVDGGRCYLVMAGDEEGLARVEEHSWFARSAAADRGLVAGLSRPVPAPDGVAAARDEADRVADALLDGVVPGPAATPARTWPHLLLTEVRQRLRADDALRYGRAAALAAHDRTHGTEYVPTLAAFLRLRGDSTATAAALHIHPNTLRYRVRRACEIAGIDLDDAVERLVVELQLHALGGR